MGLEVGGDPLLTQTLAGYETNDKLPSMTPLQESISFLQNN